MMNIMMIISAKMMATAPCFVTLDDIISSLQPSP